MEFIKSVNRVYAKLENKSELDVPTLVSKLRSWFYQYPEYSFLHPCIINNQAALVCNANLSKLSPKAYLALVEITQKHDIFLKQDGRNKDKQQAVNRRTNTAVVLGFCLGMMSVPALSRNNLLTENLQVKNQVTTELIMGGSHITALVKQKNGLRVISLRHVAPPSVEQVLNSYKHTKQRQVVDPHALYKITHFLKQAYQQQVGDPVSIKVDLQKMAHYYAQYPQVVELITELSDKNVLLKYKKSHWQSQAIGSQHSVDQVTVFFDTRIGAQLWLSSGCKANPACNITPADALLHELLHAKLMIVDSEEFIQSGGMKPTLYLFDHEKQVIKQENILYREMSHQDGLARPIRTRHTGDLMYASCALCLPTQ